jgi:hypothetical protein
MRILEQGLRDETAEVVRADAKVAALKEIRERTEREIGQSMSTVNEPPESVRMRELGQKAVERIHELSKRSPSWFACLAK